MGHVTPTDLCPSCGARFDRATGIDHPSAPEPGDFTVCISCGALLRFDAALRTEPATAEDWAALEPEQATMIRRAQALLRARR